MSQFTNTLPLTHTTLLSILEGVDYLRNRVSELIDSQPNNKHDAQPDRSVGLRMDMNQNCNHTHHPSTHDCNPRHIDTPSMSLYEGTASPKLPRYKHAYPPSPDVPSMSALLPSPSPKQFREVHCRMGLGAWQPPVSRGKPRVTRTAPDRKRRRDNRGKKEGNRRNRKRVESGEESSESEDSWSDDGGEGEDDESREDREDREYGRGGMSGGEGIAVGR
jgi:hypothetical protein